MPAIESAVENLWVAKQTARGTPATVAVKRGRKTGGEMTVNRDDANENYTDGARYNTAVDFVNTIIGNGAPVLQAQAGVVGYLTYLLAGQETVTGAADPFTHVATPLNGGGFWCTFWDSVGQAIALKQKYNDCRLVSLRIEGSSAAKVVKITPTFLSLDAGEIYTTDPVKADDGVEPFLYTEAVGTFTIDGTVFKGHSSCAVVISDNISPWYGDDVVAHDIVFGRGTITLEGITILVDAAGLAQYFKILYNTTAPAAGAKPVKTVPALGSYSFNLTRGATRQLMVELPGVKWSPDLSIPGNPDGGAVELALAGEVRAVAGQPMYRVTTKSSDAAYT